MKKKDILRIDSFISTARLNTFDRDTRLALCVNHLRLFRVVQGFNEEVEELKNSLTKGNEDEVTRLMKYRTEKNEEAIKSECQKALELEATLNRCVDDILEEDVEVDLRKVDIDRFLEGCISGDIPLTPKDLEVFSEMFSEVEEKV